MKNIDNKTKLLDKFDLQIFKKLLENHPMHIATVTKQNLPNIAVASDIKVLDGKTIMISNNEMIHTPDNILHNPNVVLTCFNEKWADVRMTGTAGYFTKGEYFDLCNKFFNNETATPKGVIVVTVSFVESIA